MNFQEILLLAIVAFQLPGTSANIGYSTICKDLETSCSNDFDCSKDELCIKLPNNNCGFCTLYYKERNMCSDYNSCFHHYDCPSSTICHKNLGQNCGTCIMKTNEISLIPVKNLFCNKPNECIQDVQCPIGFQCQLNFYNKCGKCIHNIGLIRKVRSKEESVCGSEMSCTDNFDCDSDYTCKKEKDDMCGVCKSQDDQNSLEEKICKGPGLCKFDSDCKDFNKCSISKGNDCGRCLSFKIKHEPRDINQSDTQSNTSKICQKPHFCDKDNDCDKGFFCSEKYKEDHCGKCINYKTSGEEATHGSNDIENESTKQFLCESPQFCNVHSDCNENFKCLKAKGDFCGMCSPSTLKRFFNVLDNSDKDSTPDSSFCKCFTSKECALGFYCYIPSKFHCGYCVLIKCKGEHCNDEKTFTLAANTNSKTDNNNKQTCSGLNSCIHESDCKSTTYCKMSNDNCGTCVPNLITDKGKRDGTPVDNCYHDCNSNDDCPSNFKCASKSQDSCDKFCIKVKTNRKDGY